MTQTAWTNAVLLASGATVGALIAYMVLKQTNADAKAKAGARHTSRPQSPTTQQRRGRILNCSSNNGQAEIDRPHYQLSKDLNEYDDQWHRSQQPSPSYNHLPRLQEAIERRHRLPSLIILVRHGESEGNADNTLYRTKPDNLVELTQKGIQQSKKAGERIKNLFDQYDKEQQQLREKLRSRQQIQQHRGLRESCAENRNQNDDGDDPRATSATTESATAASSLHTNIKRVHLIISPFERTMQTAAAMRSALEYLIVRTDIQPRIREQEFGNLQGDDFQLFRNEQKKVGRFWYRFPTGESGSDVYDRVQSWWFDSVLNVNERVGYAPINALVVVTHGLTMRFVLMQLYGWSPTTFHSIWNADNCDIYVLRKDLTKPGLSPYILDETHGGNMPKSSIDLLVEFHEDNREEVEGAIGDDSPTESNEERRRRGQQRKQKQFRLSGYLSLPPPRTKQLELVKQKLFEQYPEEIANVDRIKSIMFLPFTDGAIRHGRSRSCELPRQDLEMEMEEEVEAE